MKLISGLLPEVNEIPVFQPLEALLDEEADQAAEEGSAAFKLAHDAASALDYTQIVVPTPTTLPLNLTGLPADLATSLQAFAQDAANGAADANAALTSFNRAQSAFSAGDINSEQLQLTALDALTVNLALPKPRRAGISSL